MKKKVFTPAYKGDKKQLKRFVKKFNKLGERFVDGDRNTIKLFDFNGEKISIKAFKIPNLVNQIAYNYFRKSKAQRSFEFATRLLELGIGTPEPIAYFEKTTPYLFKKSYYISKYVDYDITYRELTTDFNIPNYENILRAFTRFTFKLHENGVHFLDHSPGNTLIQYNKGNYKFYLVDLNRMEFGTLDFETRIKNFSRLTIHKSMVEVMSDEYAKCSGEDYQTIFDLMWGETEAFQEKYHNKQRLKKKLKFWKKD
ncbi:Kdo domain containing protein [Tamlana sp. s12]|uniref:lipopolysaccharide kinase InaA family protein n=1 Tax=Tamlana sp. s12 TaxID=1630406 RepID=UPI0007FCE8D2|nr:lipopolysaccharide kinase InaA family protein [Tamlana sp. s12]OBQ56503.1 Kdo domain containing protein [Tamlana sp. s12]QQY81871.1 Kdo domain containing protein [Tamlana sp. s12]